MFARGCRWCGDGVVDGLKMWWGWCWRCVVLVMLRGWFVDVFVMVCLCVGDELGRCWGWCVVVVVRRWCCGCVLDDCVLCWECCVDVVCR